MAVILIQCPKQTQESSIPTKCEDNVNLLLQQLVALVTELGDIANHRPDLYSLLIVLAILFNEPLHFFLDQIVRPLFKIDGANDLFAHLSLFLEEILQTAYHHLYSLFVFTFANADIKQHSDKIPRTQFGSKWRPQVFEHGCLVILVIITIFSVNACQLMLRARFQRVH